MVRAVGIEPTLLAERDFESRASTNSTTPALRDAYSAATKTRNGKHKLHSLCCWLRGLLSGSNWRGSHLANIDGGCVDVVLQMPPVELLYHFDASAAVLSDLINISAFEQSQADIGMPQAVAGADMAIAVKLQIQLVENRVHQFARRFPEDAIGRLELLALANALEGQDCTGHRLAETDPSLAAHLDLQNALAGRFVVYNLDVPQLKPRRLPQKKT